MGVTFLSPWAWLLAGAVVLPILIHLLARTRSRRVAFPSLRFLEATPLSAVTRRTLQDWPLLLVRIAVVLAAVAALATPVFITPAREAAWASRVARAVVLDDSAAPPEDELRSAAVGATFSRSRVRDAVADAARWLADQRPAHREIVVLSAFKRGAVDAADFVGVPPEVGIRLVRSSNGTAVRERDITRLQLRDEGLVRVLERVTLGPRATEIREIRADPMPAAPVTVTAAEGERAVADAALRAVLRRGLRLPPAGLLQPVEVAWTGDVASLALSIESRLAAPLDAWEPEPMSDAELAVLARPSATAQDARPDDLGDRRTLWALVLVLLGLETWLRRGGTWT
ncbi:MAG: BatA domain-containing protein [Acidobacteria bacterium]|nr:BatA domain-containing protein [Acidobacteriota bacterium]